MDQRQGQQRQSQGGVPTPAPPPIAPNPAGATGAPGAHHAYAAANPGQGISPHLMGLMTNPALAAAAAASPLFPPAAMITNPGAFLAMPDMYAGNGSVPSAQNGQTTTTATTTIQQSPMTGGPVAPGHTQIASAMAVYGGGTQHQQQQQPQQFQVNHSHPAAPLQIGQPANPTTIHYGSTPLQPANMTSSSVQVHMAATTAATEAVAGNVEKKGTAEKTPGRRRKDLSPAERAKQNRDRNREHARSTRLRKKAYIQKLKELVEGLHAERTEEVRQRRVAIQHLAEMQNVRRAVIRSFLRFHSNYEKDVRKWSTILEDDFWLKQPVTPYRYFRRNEIEQECRMSRSIEAVISDSASVSVMIEGVGSRSVRWMQIKREDFFLREEERTGGKYMPKNIVRQSARFQHAVSSLSSSSNSSNNGSSGEEGNKKPKGRTEPRNHATQSISTSSGSNKNNSRRKQPPPDSSGDFHDYHARPLPDPKLGDSEPSSASASEDSPESSAEDTKRVSTDTSSGDDSAAAIKHTRTTTAKRRKLDLSANLPNASNSAGSVAATSTSSYLPGNIAKKGGIAHNVRPKATQVPLQRNGNARLSMAPAIPLPPFAGLGKRPQPVAVQPSETGGAAAAAAAVVAATTGGKSRPQNGDIPDSSQVAEKSNGQGDGSRSRSDLVNVALDGPAVIIGDVETSSSISSKNRTQIRAYYHVNEDDMILMDDIMMCPFVFRTQDAVLCGALAECVMPGMLRGHFSARNKLQSLEMIYDSMGFMQQLERASGSEMTAQIIPGSLEMALSPTTSEARVITLAEPPYQIVNVNEAWTKLTKYTQMEVEGMELFIILDGETPEDRAPNLPYSLEDVTAGRCSCTTRFHIDKDGREFVDFISSYPLTNTNDEVTHILHVSKELPPLQESVEIQEPAIDQDS